MMPRTLRWKNTDSPVFSWHDNSLNTVRLIAAISVMYGHARVHMGVATPAALDWLLNFFFGVPIYFCLSGYLIWNSIGRSKSFVHYGKKRFWRIYPELWCAVALEVVVLLILADQPVSMGIVGLFALTQGTVLQFWTPDALRFYGCGTPNGSLWTICVMIQFYLVAYFAYKLLRGQKLGKWMAALGIFSGIAIGSPFLIRVLPEIVYKLYNQTFLPYFWLFLLGALTAQYCDRVVPFLMKYGYVFLAVSAAVIVTGVDVNSGPYEYGILRCSTLFFGLLGFSYRFPGLKTKRDISYGIYVYHMTVVNAMIELGYTNRFSGLVIAMGISCVLAAASERVFSALAAGQRRKIES